MHVSERDIFDFVFYPENLSKQKNEYLKNSNLFSEEINFYSLLKKSLEEEISEEVKLKIAQNILLYTYVKVFVLYPAREIKKKRKNDVTILATASEKEKSSVEVKTFLDENNQYLIRLLNFKNSAKIYVFSTTEEVIRIYKVVIHPTKITFEQSDNSSPIEIDTPIEAKKIELKFN